MSLTDVLRRRGAVGVAMEVVRRAGSAVYRDRRLLIFQAPVDQVQRILPRLDATSVFTTRVVSLNEGLELSSAEPALRRVFESHVGDLRPGEQILFGRVDGRLAAWNIVACASRERWPLTETDSELPLTRADAVFTAGFVVPAFRGRGLFQAMYGASAGLAATAGARTLWSWCEQWNEASRRAMLAVGFHYVGWHARRTIFGTRGRLRVDMDPAPASNP